MNNTDNTTKIDATSPTKTGRKNKTKTQLKLMESHFTITQLMVENPDMKEITLRVKLKKFVDNGIVSELGTINMAKGRPKLVFSVAPVSKQTVESAKNAGVMFSESMSVKILDIKDSSVTVSKPAHSHQEKISA
jgi:hypothetical protein